MSPAMVWLEVGVVFFAAITPAIVEGVTALEGRIGRWRSLRKAWPQRVEGQ